jgi:flagellar basal body-associated protein FliL
MNKKIIIVSVVIVFILVAIGSYYFLVKPYLEEIQEKSIEYGVESTIYQLVNLSKNCSEISINYNNSTIRLIDVSCFNITKK